MELSADFLNRCLTAATAAAYRAGARIMTHFGTALDVGSKGREHLAGDVVTVADKESQAIIQEVLAVAGPDIGFVAEEEGQDANPSRFERECFWCVDPMDGTLPFLERANGFAVSIALVSREGRPLVGVAYAPALNELYHAVAGGGAFVNGQPLAAEIASGTLHMSIGPNDCIPPENNAALNYILDGLRAHERVNKIAPFLHAGAVVKACWTCLTQPACHLSFPRAKGGASIWDYAAPACIVQAAGGWASDLFGQPLELNRRESTFMHHRGILFASDEELARLAIERYGEWRARAGG